MALNKKGPRPGDHSCGQVELRDEEKREETLMRKDADGEINEMMYI